MDAASQNSSFLLASLISGQGAGMSAAGVAQAVDNSNKSVGSSFLSSFNLSSQELQSEDVSTVMSLDMDGLLLTVDKLLAGHAATTGAGLPLLEGQDFAADMSNEDVLAVISQLEGEGAEAVVGQLASLLQGQAGMTGNVDVLSGLRGQTENAAVLSGIQGQIGIPGNEAVQSIISQLQGTTVSELTTQQHKQQVDALFARIRQRFENTASSDISSRLSQTAIANMELVEQSQPADRRLMERLNAVLAQQSQTAEAVKAGGSLRQLASEAGLNQLGEDSGSFSSADINKDLSGKAVVTPIPMLLQRMAAVSNERQLNTGGLDSVDTSASIVQLGKADGTPANSSPRPVTSFIQTSFNAPQWQSEFSDKVMMMSRVAGQGQNQVAEIRLNPAHLGPIEVRVVMKDEQASIIFSAQHGVVRDAIEASMPRLREMFSNSGLMLADANVSEHSLQHQNQNRQAESDGQYSNTDATLSTTEQTELISQIDLSAISSSAALDLYA